MECLKQIEKIKTDFSQSRKMLLAIGDETRQSIITALMGIGYGGLRVGEITAKTHLSRPAVSHHLKILLDCGLVTRKKQGTKNFYSLHIGEEFETLQRLITHIIEFKTATEEGVYTTCSACQESHAATQIVSV